MHGGPRPREIGAHIEQVLLRLELLLKNTLRRKMQHSQTIRQQVRLPLQVQPEQAVSLTRATSGALHVYPGRFGRMAQVSERREDAAAERTLDFLCSRRR